MASAPTPLRAKSPPSKGKGIEKWAWYPCSGERSAFDEALVSPTTRGSQGSQQVVPQAIREPSVNTQASTVDFLAADLPYKCALVEKLPKSWALALSDSMKPSSVNEEQAAITEAMSNSFHSFYFLPFFIFG